MQEGDSETKKKIRLEHHQCLKIDFKEIENHVSALATVNIHTAYLKDPFFTFFHLNSPLLLRI